MVRKSHCPPVDDGAVQACAQNPLPTGAERSSVACATTGFGRASPTSARTLLLKASAGAAITSATAAVSPKARTTARSR